MTDEQAELRLQRLADEVHRKAFTIAVECGADPDLLDGKWGNVTKSIVASVTEAFAVGLKIGSRRTK